MAVWTLDKASEFTEFQFLAKEEFFLSYNTIAIYLETAQMIQSIWPSVYMKRSEPQKHPDFFEILDTDLIAISQKATEKLLPAFNDKIELLPIETDAGRYYALNVMNLVDCLDKDASKFVATKEGIIVDYSLLEFDEEKIGDNIIFKIPELPYAIFITDEFQDICEEENLQGLLFDPETNLIWYPE